MWWSVEGTVQSLVLQGGQISARSRRTCRAQQLRQASRLLRLPRGPAWPVRRLNRKSINVPIESAGLDPCPISTELAIFEFACSRSRHIPAIAVSGVDRHAQNSFVLEFRLCVVGVGGIAKQRLVPSKTLICLQIDGRLRWRCRCCCCGNGHRSRHGRT